MSRQEYVAQLGMALGADLTFLVAGMDALLPAAIAVWMLDKCTVLVIYIALVLSGSSAPDLVFEVGSGSKRPLSRLEIATLEINSETMVKAELHVIDAFTQSPGLGNRAGVVLDAARLSDDEMGSIAAFAGYSETAFILPPENDSHQLCVRYFTPTKEVPICGHATVAAHYLRACHGHRHEYPLIARTGAGDLPVSLEKQEAGLLVSMTQARPEFMDELDRNSVATALRIAPTEIVDMPVQVVSTGHSKVMILLHRRETLDALRPDMHQLSAISAQIGSNGFSPFTLEGTRTSPSTYGRMFAPAIGISEGPVTGNANGPAGAYLVHYDLIDCNGSITFPANQGVAMGKPGRVFVTVTRSQSELQISITGHAISAGTRLYNSKINDDCTPMLAMFDSDVT